ncbi:molybdate ABC transporter substrate-binding protein [Caminibacter sp.]
MKKILFISFLAIFSLADVYVAAASNINYALPELIKEFNKKYPEINIKTVLASSGKLSAQIIHGAPYDIFLAANMKYPKFLYKKGFAKTKPKVYAKGAIILFSIKIKNLDLKKLKSVNQIAVANPKTAPYGEAALEAFKNAGIDKCIKNKLIYAETVSSVIPYVYHSADVGVIAKSLIYSKKLRNKRFYYKDIPYNLYTPINQGVVLLKDNEEAKKFYRFIFSEEAKKILKKYGYIVNE